MLTATRFLAATATTMLLALPLLAQPVTGLGPVTPRPIAGHQQTAPTKAAPSLALASARVADSSSHTAEAPQTVVLTGMVVRADGRPLPGAGVYIVGLAKQVVVTDERGAFALPIPVGQSVAVLAEYFGLGSTRISVAQPLAQPLRITIGN